MPDQAVITQTVTESKWPVNQKTKLTEALAKVGPRTSDFLLSKMKSDFQDSFAQAGQYAAQWPEMMQKNQTAEVKQQFQDAWYSGDFDFGRYLLPITEDILGSSKISVPAELKQMFVSLEVELIDNLSRRELLRLLKENLVLWTGASNLVADLQRYAYYHLISSEDSTWGEDFIRAMAGNEEKLGNSVFKIQNKEFNPLIKNWIADFWQTAGNNALRSTYDVVKYMEQSEWVKFLNAGERESLVEILKAYNWLHALQLNETEVVKYERQLFDDYDKRRDNFLNPPMPPEASPRTVVNEPMQRPVPPSAPRPSSNIQDILRQRDSQNLGGVVRNQQTNVNLGEAAKQHEVLRQKQQADIDQKIRDLKKRNQN